jgi:hypothetical protein
MTEAWNNDLITTAKVIYEEKAMMFAEDRLGFINFRLSEAGRRPASLEIHY